MLLNARGSLAEDGWDNPDRPLLWRYNLHYFDDLTASEAPRRAAWHRALIAEWIAANRPDSGTGWQPYPLSLRIVNWIKWALAGNDLGNEALHSLAHQARALERKIEWHLLGNHLFSNGKALVFAGLFFGGKEGERWLDRGAHILERQLPEQFLPDGAQFELSPMYHALAVEDLLDLANMLAAFGYPRIAWLNDAIRRHIRPALDWLAALSHPDQGVAFFNDAAFGIAPTLSELVAYASRLGFAPPAAPPSPWLGESGYARLANDRATLFLDLARVGPDHLPGHAHADTLSLEFSFGASRIIVNSGTSIYALGTERQRQRGTRAHSTVTVDDENSSETWAAFRVGRRAVPFDTYARAGGDRLEAGGAHDGYRHLGTRAVHRRRVTLGEHGLTVEDSVTPDTPAEARFHLHPAVRISIEGPGRGLLFPPEGGPIRWNAQAAAVRVEASSYHPEFGVSLPSSCLSLTLGGGCSTLSLEWD
ncbi:heparinase II/III family protein [Rhizorhabdus dicambivorans]|nr:heparinase II/III family protein [Rhizorhabdus dicambivorans]